MKKILLATAFLFGLCGFADASFVQSQQIPPGPNVSPRPDTSTNTLVNLTQSSFTEYLSPFPDTSDYRGAPYTAVQRFGSALFNINGTRLNLIWGSPDPYNNLRLFSGPNGTGDLLETINGAQINSAAGYSYVMITEAVPFQSVLFTNDGPLNGFEFANLVAFGEPQRIAMRHRHMR